MDANALLPFKHSDVRLGLARDASGDRQGLGIGRQLDLLRVKDVAIDLVRHLQRTLVTRHIEEVAPGGTFGYLLIARAAIPS